MVRKKALMVTHSYYPRDPRVRREAEALVAEGYEVDVICLRDEGERWRERVNGVGIHRLPVRRHRRSGAIVYALEYAAFFVMACVCVALLFAARGHRLYQTHTIPDFLVFSTILPRILGAPVVLDMHEVMPEFFAAKFGLGARHPLVLVLEFLERISTGFASAVMTVSDPIREILVRRGTPARKVTVVMNSADDRLFGGFQMRTRKAPSETGILRLAYHGMLSELYDLEPVIRAIAGLRERNVRGVELHILGGGTRRERYRSLVQELGLATEVVFHDEIPVEQVPAFLAEMDAGVIPLRRAAFTDLAMPTKLLECISMGLPVLVARRATIASYFDDGSLLFFEPEDSSSIAAAIEKFRSAPESRAGFSERARARYAPISWPVMRRRYLEQVERLVAGGA